MLSINWDLFFHTSCLSAILYLVSFVSLDRMRLCFKVFNWQWWNSLMCMLRSIENGIRMIWAGFISILLLGPNQKISNGMWNFDWIEIVTFTFYKWFKGDQCAFKQYDAHQKPTHYKTLRSMHSLVNVTGTHCIRFVWIETCGHRCLSSSSSSS